MILYVCMYNARNANGLAAAKKFLQFENRNSSSIINK